MFRAAVLQNAVALHVREFKNAQGMGQEQLARLDLRPDALNKWNGRLTGRIPLTTRDLATLMTILPGALPSEAEIKVFLDVAEKRIAPPAEWRWPDS